MATARQRIALGNLVKNGGNVSQAMRDAGYSPNSVNKPEVLTRSEGFARLLDEMGITTEELAKTLKGGLQAKNKDGDDDWTIRHRYLETGLRLQGLGPQNVTANFNFNNYAGDQRAIYNLS